jgi:hypothetical protein
MEVIVLKGEVSLTTPEGAPATFSMRAVMSVFSLRFSTFTKTCRPFGS